MLCWLRPDFQSRAGYDYSSYSILIPARNEAHNITPLLRSLKKNDLANTEIIIIDDHSEDDTRGVIIKYEADFGLNIRYIRLNDDEYGKKQALNRGVKEADGRVIITMDADVTVGANWLKTIREAMGESEQKLLILPVLIEGSGVLGVFQALEQRILMFFTHASAKVGRPMLCSGANLVYHKSLFEKLNPYEDNLDIASGDDMFLLMKAKKLPDVNIETCLNKNAVAHTRASMTLKSFFYQRVRWAKKTSVMDIPESKLLGFIIILFNCLLLITTLSLIKNPVLSYSVTISWLCKFLFDLLLLFLVSWKLTVLKSISWFPVVFALYPIYIVFVTIASLVIKPKWKLRKLDNG